MCLAGAAVRAAARGLAQLPSGGQTDRQIDRHSSGRPASGELTRRGSSADMRGASSPAGSGVWVQRFVDDELRVMMTPSIFILRKQA